MIEQLFGPTPSTSARAVCWCRALETQQDSKQRCLRDTFASYFLSDLERTLLPTTAYLGTRWAEVASNGLYREVVERHATIDRWLEDALQSGIRRLVVLGAGYDSRAWRFAHPELQTIELDQPMTQDRKRRCIRRFAARFPEVNLDLRPVDFRKDTWTDALPSGPQPSVVIWEGVTMYLTKVAVESTVRALTQHLAPQSQILVDVLHPQAPLRASTSAARWGLGLVGEPLKWSLDLDAEPEFFAHLGLSMLERAQLGATCPRHHIDVVRLLRN